jgi:ADP-ribose pyrophosphatase
LSQQKEKAISSRQIYKGKIINLRLDEVKLPNNQKTSREVVEHAQSVAIVALDERKNVFLVRQYRYPGQKELLEIPAGILGEGEEPVQGAQRELAEETGIKARRWQYLFSIYSSPGFTDEQIHLFYARDLQFAGQCLDEDEFIKVIKVPLEQIPQMIKQGEICDAKTIAGLLGAQLYA